MDAGLETAFSSVEAELPLLIFLFSKSPEYDIAGAGFQMWVPGRLNTLLFPEFNDH